jgi:ankyrin
VSRQTVGCLIILGIEVSDFPGISGLHSLRVDVVLQDRQTALHVASRTGDADTVELLLDSGADVDAVTADQYTALHIAAKEGHDDIARVLLTRSTASCKRTTKVSNSLHAFLMCTP